MMNPVTIALIALTIVYVIAIRLANRRGYFPEWVDVYGPCLMLTTDRGKDILDSIAKSRPNLWRKWGDAGVLVASAVLIGQFALLLFAASVTLLNPPEPSSVHQPTNMLVIPGVNDFMPLSVLGEVVIALTAALVVHEGGHGLYCRVGDIDIDRMGTLLLGVIPVGAFVEADEEQREAASLLPSLRMYAAGVMNNFALSAVCFILLFGLTGMLVAPAPGAAIGAVHPDSPADAAGIEAGDRITAVNGTDVSSNQAFNTEVESQSAATLSLTLNNEQTVTVDRQAYVTGSIDGTGVGPGVTIQRVDGVAVQTTDDFTSALRNSNGSTASVTLADGTTREIIAGVPIQVAKGSPAADAGLKPGHTVYITHINGERYVESTRAETALSNLSTTANLTVVDGSNQTTVTLHPESGSPTTGMHFGGGVAGLQVADIGVQLYTTDTYLGFASGDFSSLGSPISVALVLMSLPMASFVGLPYNFAGFTGEQANFFAVPGLPPELTGAVFFVLNALFWTAWVNLHLGLFNCIPTVVLDGGHMVRDTASALAEKAGLETASRASSVVTMSILLSMLLALLTVIFVPTLLG